MTREQLLCEEFAGLKLNEKGLADFSDFSSAVKRQARRTKNISQCLGPCLKILPLPLLPPSLSKLAKRRLQRFLNFFVVDPNIRVKAKAKELLESRLPGAARALLISDLFFHK